MRIDSSGRVGIGESSPAAGLDVKADTNPVLAIDRGSANTANFNLQYNGTTTGQLSAANSDFQISAAGASTPISFFTNGSERMRIDSSGNITVAGGVATSDGTNIQSNGILKLRADSINATSSAISIFRNGTSASNILTRINHDGSAQFGSYVISGQNPAGGLNNGAMLTTDGTVQVSRGSGSNIWAGYATGTTAATSLITSSGDATFDSAVQTGDFDSNDAAANGTRVGAGVVYAKRASTNNTDLFRGYKGNDIVFNVEDDGTATFGGDVQSGY